MWYAITTTGVSGGKDGQDGRGGNERGEGERPDHTACTHVDFNYPATVRPLIPHLSCCLAFVLLSLLLCHDLSSLESKLLHQVLLEGPLGWKSRVLDFGCLGATGGLPLLLQVLLHLFDDLIFLFQRHALTLGGGTLFRHGGCVLSQAASLQVKRLRLTKLMLMARGRANGWTAQLLGLLRRRVEC